MPMCLSMCGADGRGKEWRVLPGQPEEGRRVSGRNYHLQAPVLPSAGKVNRALTGARNRGLIRLHSEKAATKIYERQSDSASN